MLSLLRRPKPRPSRISSFHTRLRLECLEGRELPSVTHVLDGVMPSGGQSASMLQAALAAPQITSFSATQVAGSQTWIFSGTVASADPLSTTLQFGGLASLSGRSCSVQADGAFSLTVTLQSGESGMASAQATDNVAGLASAVVYCPVYPVSGFTPLPGGNRMSN
jgi:hypothetical protein